MSNQPTDNQALINGQSAAHTDKDSPVVNSLTRDSRLDSLRGLALIIMMIDHLQGNLKEITYHIFGFITAAEMFIFLSGLVAGIVYMNYYKSRSLKDVVIKCSRRAGTLYLYHILTFIILIAIGMLSETMSTAWAAWVPHFSGALLLEAPGKALGLASVLLYQPTHLDILPMYAILLLLMPGALALIRRWGPLPLIAISSAFWLLARKGEAYFWIGEQIAPLGVKAPYFDIVAWQILFFFGLSCGAARTLSQPWLGKLIRWGWIPAFLVSLACLALRYDIISTKWILTVFDFRASTKIPWLGWFRLMNFLCIALAVAGLASKWPKLFKWPWFSLLGRHSLQVYTAHIGIIFLAAPLCGWVAGTKSTGWDYALTIGSLLVLTLTAWLHQKWVDARKASRQASA